jgi:glycosyltransferase involved in cell wall biosynthesis
MLWIIHDYVPFVNAGSEICTHTLNKYLLNGALFDVWVASPGYPQCIYEGIHCFDLLNRTLLFEVLGTADILNTHAHYRKQGMDLCRITGKPYVEWVHTHNHLRSIGTAPWMDPRIQGRQWTVFNARTLQDLRPDALQSRVFHPSVDYREYAVDRTGGRYVTLSNVNENKGGAILIELARALPEMEFLGICGGYRAQLTDHTLPNLHYVPHTADIRRYYAQTWVQIMPSREETWGRTAVEAMASGIPVVASNTPGLRECCGDAALYCDREDVAAWVRTLRALRNDSGLYAERSAAAYARARALDPRPQLADMARWLRETVVPSAIPGRSLTWMEKNLLHW